MHASHGARWVRTLGLSDLSDLSAAVSLASLELRGGPRLFFFLVVRTGPVLGKRPRDCTTELPLVGACFAVFNHLFVGSVAGSEKTDCVEGTAAGVGVDEAGTTADTTVGVATIGTGTTGNSANETEVGIDGWMGENNECPPQQ